MTRGESSCESAALSLSDLSPRDITWKIVKPQCQMTANAYAGTAYDKYYKRMQDCCGWLKFALVPTTTDEPVHKLQEAFLCHVRHCPICQWRRSLMWRARIFRAMRRIIPDYPGKRFIYLTLTVKNCELDKLGETLTHMNESWQRLVKRKEFPAIGWLRSVEVTRGKDGSAHPHFHALLMVNTGYFTKYYLSQKRWRELWAESLRVEYDPQVDIKVVKPLKQSNTDTSESSDIDNQDSIQKMDEGIVAAIRYTVKYSTKPDEWLNTDTSVTELDKESQHWLLGITEQLHKRRSMAVGGIFKKYIAEEDPRNLIKDDTAAASDTQEEDPRVTYVWRDEVTNYLIST